MSVPLRLPVFRRMWAGTLVSNLGMMIQGVGAAWSMTQLTKAADLVALVQTAQMAPIMIFALTAGAIADMYDRRKVAMIALVCACASSTMLATLSFLHLLTPWVVLGFCFLIGSSMAFLSPSSQSSVTEQVPPSALPSAIALNSISYNIARSFGPALGGVIVAAAGAQAAFGVNALLYIPLFVVLLLWKRVVEASRLPPEGLGRAIVSGVRYVTNSPPIRNLLFRIVITGVVGSALQALLPLVAKTLLHGNASTYGLLLGAFGVGAVMGALNLAKLRARFAPEHLVRGLALSMAAAVAVSALSHSAIVTALALVVAGGSWMLTVTNFNIGIQTSAPRWVGGRALAAYQASISGGLAAGAWLWGNVAQAHGVQIALLCSATGLLLTPFLGLWLSVPAGASRAEVSESTLDDPEVRMALTGRSGPIVVQVEYRISAEAARPFYRLMQQLQGARQRNGAYGWTLARDIAEPDLWVETFSCPTWHDYLRQRSRTTQAEWELRRQAHAYHMSTEPIRVHRRLERPFGSVRWKEEAPDTGADSAAEAAQSGGS